MSNPFIPTNDPSVVQNNPDVQVTIASVGIDGSSTAYDPSIPIDTVYTHYKIINRFEKDGHRYNAGVTSPNGFLKSTTVVFQLAAPTLLWVCRWTACRFNEPPEIPDSEPFDPGWVLLDQSIENMSLDVMPTGNTPVYRISGTYVYGHQNPDDDILQHTVFGRPAWMINGKFQRGNGNGVVSIGKLIADDISVKITNSPRAPGLVS